MVHNLESGTGNVLTVGRAVGSEYYVLYEKLAIRHTIPFYENGIVWRPEALENNT
eukprot:COSAG02_NODE_4254_length_5581_cov_2.070595_7_plen_54_part_01